METFPICNNMIAKVTTSVTLKLQLEKIMKLKVSFPKKAPTVKNVYKTIDPSETPLNGPRKSPPV